MKLPHFKKKYFAGAAAAGLAMGAGGFAAAYFTATGTGTGRASVGHATPFTVTQTSRSADLYPGTSQAVTFKIRNVGHGIQHWAINSTQVTVATTAGNIVTANKVAAATGTTVGKGVTGCKASWFTLSVQNQSGNLNPGGTTTFGVSVSMTNGTGSSGSPQTACETTFPLLNVALSGPVPGFALYALPGSSAHWTQANKAAVLTLGTGDGAGIQLLKPSSTLPTTAPTFTSSAYGGGSPRWDIFFSTGNYIFGTGSPSGSGWTTSGVDVTNTHHLVSGQNTWADVLTEDGSKSVKAVAVVMTAGQTGATDTITNLTYDGLGF